MSLRNKIDDINAFRGQCIDSIQRLEKSLETSKKQLRDATDEVVELYLLLDQERDRDVREVKEQEGGE